MENLVDNALRYNVDGGRLEIGTGTRDGAAILALSNSGPVVPADQIERIFRPFERLGDRRDQVSAGHGLGLSIVQAIAIAHGARLTAQPRSDGGLHVEVWFPPEPPGQLAASSRNRSASAV